MTRRDGPWFQIIEQRNLIPVPLNVRGQFYQDSVFLVLRLNGEKGTVVYVEPAGGGMTLIFRSDARADPFLATDAIDYSSMRTFADQNGASIPHYPFSWTRDVKQHLLQTAGIAL